MSINNRNIVLNQANVLIVIGTLIFFSVIISKVSELQADFAELSAVENAHIIAESISTVRAVYTSEVINRLTDKNISVTHDYIEHKGAIPLPATLSMKIGKDIGEKIEGLSVRLFSKYPFPWRMEEGGLQDEFDKEAWSKLINNPDKPYFSFEKNESGSSFLRYAIADKMLASCVHCHNAHPDTPKNDWQVGELRGILEIRYPMKAAIAQNSRGLKHLYSIMTVIGTISLAILFLFLARAQRHELFVQQKNKELQLTNKELIVKTTALEETSRYKSEFLANMSHELRTPLNSLLILSNSLAENEDGHLSEDEQVSALVIRDSGKHLLGLINDILDLSKVEAGKMIVENKPINFSELLEALDSQFIHVAKDKNIGFSISLAENLPVDFISDEIKFKQIITNLISNAIKFTSEGQVSLKIELIESSSVLKHHEKVFAFSVIDTGIGITESQQAMVFEAFQQADSSTSRQYGGTGLGLSIALNLSQLLGGQLKLTSKLDQGSTFTLYLPAQLDVTTAHSFPPLITDISDSKSKSLEDSDEDTMLLDVEDSQLKGSIVLLVDDDMRNTFALAKTLRDKKLIVHIAASGKDALDSLEKYEGINIVLMDIMMSEMDGYQTIEHIREHDKFRDLPIIALTAKAMDGDKEKCMTAGASDYLAKPVDIQKLLVMMKNWI